MNDKYWLEVDMELQQIDSEQSAQQGSDVTRFLEEMVRYVEQRKQEISEESAIDEFLARWRAQLNDENSVVEFKSEFTANVSNAVSANVIPFPIFKKLANG